MRLRETIYPFVLWGCLTLVPVAAIAQEAPRSATGLTHGMGFYDVAKVWGRPLEKRQQEAQREEVWLYPSAKVVFQEGKVVAWMAGSPAPALRAPGALPSPTPNQEKMEQILGEILDDLPTPVP